MDIKQYMEQRVDDQINYFDSKSIKNKKWYFCLSKCKIIASAIITFLSLAFGEKSCLSYVVAALSSAVTISESIMNLSQYNEKWTIYRLSNEALKKEKYLFEMNAGCYSELEKNDKDRKFVNNIEDIIENSNENWKNMSKDKEGKK